MSLIDQYLSSLAMKNFSQETIDGYEDVLRQFEVYCKGAHLSFEDFSSENVKEYILELSSRMLKPVSLNHYYSVLRLFFNFLFRIEKIKRNHFLNIRSLKIEKEAPPTLSMSEIKIVFAKIEMNDSISFRDIAMFECFYGSGIRPVELANLKVTDIDLIMEEIKIVRPGRQYKRSRTVPLPGGSVYILKLYTTSRKLRWPVSNYMFPNSKGHKINKDTVYKTIRNFLVWTKARKKGALTLRNSYAKHLLAAGADPMQIKNLMGHQSVAATLNYHMPDPYHLLRVYQESHPKA